MKNIKKIAAMAACAALAGSMTAGAVNLPKKAQTKPIVIGSEQCGSLPSQALQQLIDKLCGSILGNKPVTPDLKPGTPGNKPVAPLPGGGETNTPSKPSLTPDDTDNLPVAPLPGEGAEGENTPVTPDLKPGTPDNKPIAPLPGEDNTPDIPAEKPEAPDASLPTQAAAVVRLVNAERAKAGLSALKTDAKVQSAAQVRATEINKNFSHTRPNGASCFTALAEAGASYRGAGENIAYGQKTPAAVMQSWMNSSGHRANIMSSQFTTIGVGVAEIGGQIYWTQMFTN